MADTCIVVAGPGSLERGELTELAEIANREDGNVRASESRALQAICDGAVHAMAAGDALIAARELVEAEGSGWRQWVTESLEFSVTSSNRYMRMATYRNEIEQWIAEGGRGTIKAAESALRGLPPIRTDARPEDRAEAERLHEAGLMPTAIAKTLDCPVSTVRAWLDPDYRAARHKANRRRENVEPSPAEPPPLIFPTARLVRTEMQVAADTIWLLCSSGLIDTQRISAVDLCATAGITAAHLAEAKERARHPRVLRPRAHRVAV